MISPQPIHLPPLRTLWRRKIENLGHRASHLLSLLRLDIPQPVEHVSLPEIERPVRKQVLWDLELDSRGDIYRWLPVGRVRRGANGRLADPVQTRNRSAGVCEEWIA